MGATCVLWSAAEIISLEISSILASSSSLLLRHDISSQVDNQMAVAAGFIKHEGRNVHPQPLAGACFDLEVKIGNFEFLRSTLLDTAIAATDLRSQGAVAVQDFIARPVEHVRGRVSKQPLRSLVPRAIWPSLVTANAASAVFSRNANSSASSIPAFPPRC